MKKQNRTDSKKTRTVSAFQICLVAMAVGINLVGGQIALLLRLPVYLDSIGTIFIGAALGPWFGLAPSFLSGIAMALTGDLYSLYFAPVGMITGLLSGLLLSGRAVKGPRLFLAGLGITIPGTLASAWINTVLFGGVTSSGSTILVQVLSRTPLGLTGSIFAVQFLTDYADRCLALLAVSAFLPVLAGELRRRMAGEE